MGKIKISELFSALQGEARYVGVPSVFLRTFGCNLRCPAFGLDHNYDIEVNPEVREIIKTIPELEAQGKKLEDLPLVKSGCDTYVAVYPEFKNFSPMLTVDQIIERIRSTNPRGFDQNTHLILTGGEPLLPGWQKAYPELIDKILFDNPNLHITIETNGTQKLTKPLLDYFFNRSFNLHFSISLKLKASGEPWSKAYVPESLQSYKDAFPNFLDFKFVVATEEHVQEVDSLVHSCLNWVNPDGIYLMPEGGTNENYLKNKRTVADLALKYGYRFSPRLQCEVSDNQWGT